jgi:hypothetical protein
VAGSEGEESHICESEITRGRAQCEKCERCERCERETKPPDGGVRDREDDDAIGPPAGDGKNGSPSAVRRTERAEEIEINADEPVEAQQDVRK